MRKKTMKKIISILLISILLIACNSTVVDEKAVEVIKCDHVSNGMSYDSIIRMSDGKIMSIVLTVLSETKSDKEDVLETLEALFDTSFTYAESNELKLLTSVMNPDDLSEQSLEMLLLSGLNEKNTLEDLMDLIKTNAKDKEHTVTCSTL